MAIKAELLEEYVTGAVLDALESPRVQEALRAGDSDAAHAGRNCSPGSSGAQDVRADARRDLADGVIDRNDWLDIRQRTEDTISTARREYDRLAGSATVLGDIPPSDSVREAWESWNTDRRRAAIKAVLHKIIVKNSAARHAQQPGREHERPRRAPRARDGRPAPARRVRLARLTAVIYITPEVIHRLPGVIVSRIVSVSPSRASARKGAQRQ